MARWFFGLNNDPPVLFVFTGFVGLGDFDTLEVITGITSFVGFAVFNAFTDWDFLSTFATLTVFAALTGFFDFLGII